MRRSLFGAAVVLGLLAVPGRAGDSDAPPEGPFATGNHFRVVCHFPDPDTAREGLKAAEAVWDRAAELAGRPEQRRLAELLEIHVFRDAADLEAMKASLATGESEAPDAVPSHVAHAAYLALEPEMDPAIRVKLGMSSHMRRRIAHAAIHVVVTDSMATCANHPEWLTEGAAAWIVDEAMVAEGWSPGVEEDPFSSTRLSKCKRLVESGQFPPFRAVLLDRLHAFNAGQQGAIWWMVFRFMKAGAHRERLDSLIARLPEAGDRGSYSKSLFRRAERLWGEEGLKQLGAEFRQYVATFAPRWREVGPTMQVKGDAWTQLAFDRTTHAWRTERVGRQDFTVSGAVQVLALRSEQVSLLLGRSTKGFVSVAFRAGSSVAVYDRRHSADETERLKLIDTKAVRAGKKLPFVVRVAGGELTVEIDGEHILDVPLGDLDMSGAWGVSAEAESGAVWTGVTIE